MHENSNCWFRGNRIWFWISIKKGGNDVTLMEFRKEHIQAVQQNGLTIEVNGQQDNIEIPMDRPENIKGKFDVVFIFTKSMNLRGMLEAIEHNLAEVTKVVCLLNGLGHEKTIA